jgi:hypothetical protein
MFSLVNYSGADHLQDFINTVKCMREQVCRTKTINTENGSINKNFELLSVTTLIYFDLKLYLHQNMYPMLERSNISSHPSKHLIFDIYGAYI